MLNLCSLIVSAQEQPEEKSEETFSPKRHAQEADESAPSSSESDCEDGEDERKEIGYESPDLDVFSSSNWLPDLNPLSERVLQWLEREAKRNRPRVIDLRTLRRAQRSPSSRPTPQVAFSSRQPRAKIRRKIPARWCPKFTQSKTQCICFCLKYLIRTFSDESLTVTATPVPRKMSGGMKPVITVTPVRPNPIIKWSDDLQRGRPQLHVFIPRMESEYNSDSSER
jgi:hypothetical protein